MLLSGERDDSIMMRELAVWVFFWQDPLKMPEISPSIRPTEIFQKEIDITNTLSGQMRDMNFKRL